MSLKKYNNLLTSERWSSKYPKDAHILVLFGVSQNLADESKKSSDESNRDTTKLYPACIRYLPPWMLEDPRGGKRLRNQRSTLVVPPDVSISVKEIWIGNVLFLETLQVNFLPAPKLFWHKDALGWVWGFLYIYL